MATNTEKRIVVPLHRSITAAPGAFHDVPVVHLARMLHALGLAMGSDLVIRRTDNPRPEAATALLDQLGRIPADVRATLAEAEKWLISERDEMYEFITDAEGNIPDDDEGQHLRRLDGVIDRMQAVRRKYC